MKVMSPSTLANSIKIRTVTSFSALQQFDGGDRVVQGLRLFHSACQTTVDPQQEMMALSTFINYDITHANDNVRKTGLSYFMPYWLILVFGLFFFFKEPFRIPSKAYSIIW